jgi:hypothetical protein
MNASTVNRPVQKNVCQAIKANKSAVRTVRTIRYGKDIKTVNECKHGKQKKHMQLY